MTAFGMCFGFGGCLAYCGWLRNKNTPQDDPEVFALMDGEGKVIKRFVERDI